MATILLITSLTVAFGGVFMFRVGQEVRRDPAADSRHRCTLPCIVCRARPRALVGPRRAFRTTARAERPGPAQAASRGRTAPRSPRRTAHPPAPATPDRRYPV